MFKFVKNLFSRKDKDKTETLAEETPIQEESATPAESAPSSETTPIVSEPVLVQKTETHSSHEHDKKQEEHAPPVAPAQPELEKLLPVIEPVPEIKVLPQEEQKPEPEKKEIETATEPVVMISPDRIEIEEKIAEPSTPEMIETVDELDEETKPKKGWFSRLRDGLSRTRENLGKKIVSLFSAHKKIDDDLYEELETILLSADVGIDACEYLLEKVKAQVKRDGLETSDQLQDALKEALIELLTPLENPLALEHMENHQPFVIMMVGVNGAGKTTTIGKLAKHFQAAGKSVLLAAGDTFRAAAREQLIVWGERNNVTVIAQEKGDPAAVVYDAIQAATARKIDIVLADTAGRLATQHNLMEEIKKVKRVMKKLDETAPHEIILVLDSNTGQNGLSQVKQFDDALGLTGLVLTKLDGTAKGGIIAAIAKTRPVPVRFIGVGEGIDDLRPFIARDFVNALF